MRVLILGATGILGHKLLQKLGRSFEAYGTVRQAFDFAEAIPCWSAAGVINGVTVEDPASVANAIRLVQPDALVNCIATPPWVQTREDLCGCIAVNAKFPHELARLCEHAGVRLIHISTDGVFAGTRGQYTECDPSDASDAYGKSKFLGEVSGPNCLTLRVSLIGRDIRWPKSGLLEWFLSQPGQTVKGYRRSFFTGVTTTALAQVIRLILSDYPKLSGVFHIPGGRASKLEVLEIIRERFALPIGIEPDDSVVCDRSLDGSAFQNRTGIEPQPWTRMIDDLYEDSQCYASQAVERS